MAGRPVGLEWREVSERPSWLSLTHLPFLQVEDIVANSPWFFNGGARAAQ